MNNNKTLQKVMFSIMGKKYPSIHNVYVLSSTYSGKYYYRIYFGVKYADLVALDNDEFKSEVKSVFNYLYPHDTLEIVGFTDPES